MKSPLSARLKIKSLKLRLPGKIRPIRFDIRNETTLKGKNLQEVFHDHPDQVAFWAMQIDRIRKRVMKTAERLDIARKLRYLAFKTKFDGAWDRYTDQTLWAEVDTCDDVIRIRQELRGLRDDLGAVSAIMRALDKRLSCMIGLRSEQKREFRHDTTNLQKEVDE